VGFHRGGVGFNPNTLPPPGAWGGQQARTKRTQDAEDAAQARGERVLANTGASPQKTNYLGRPRMFAGIAQKSNLLPGKSLSLVLLMVSIT